MPLGHQPSSVVVVGQAEAAATEVSISNEGNKAAGPQGIFIYTPLSRKCMSLFFALKESGIPGN